jgi:hypothetical protein
MLGTLIQGNRKKALAMRAKEGKRGQEGISWEIFLEQHDQHAQDPQDTLLPKKAFFRAP